MSGQIRFHLDENVSNAIANGLRRRGIDITTAPEQDLRGATDEEQITFAHEQERIIFTQDDDFFKLHQKGISHRGIAYCHQGKPSIGEIIRTLALIWECVAPDDMIDQVEFL